MNIIEALKSGKKFKREHWDDWTPESDIPHIYWEKKDLLADDYIIEEEKIELSKSQILEAYAETQKHQFSRYPYPWMPTLDFQAFLRRLGFKE